MINWCWVIIGACAAAFPIPIVQKYIDTNNPLYLVLAALLYLLLIWAYYVLLQTNDMLSLYAMLKVLSIFIVALVSVTVFQETLTSRRMIGIGLACLAIYLLA